MGGEKRSRVGWLHNSGGVVLEMRAIGAVVVMEAECSLPISATSAGNLHISHTFV
jgi:hypothetical protein